MLNDETHANEEVGSLALNFEDGKRKDRVTIEAITERHIDPFFKGSLESVIDEYSEFKLNTFFETSGLITTLS
jgi:hypothetical protein